VKLRLIAGTINHWPDDGEWHNVTLDVSNRGVWDRELDMPLQPDFVGDIASLPQFRDDTFNEVRLHHVLEHLAPARGELALAELHRILKSGGVLDIEVPDLDKIAAAYTAGELDHAGVSQWLLGEQLANHESGDSHRSLWTESILSAALEAAGFAVGDPEETGLATRFRAVK
jgi:predicted SAM-dependent methyltransferase